MGESESKWHYLFKVLRLLKGKDDRVKSVQPKAVCFHEYRLHNLLAFIKPWKLFYLFILSEYTKNRANLGVEAPHLKRCFRFLETTVGGDKHQTRLLGVNGLLVDPFSCTQNVGQAGIIHWTQLTNFKRQHHFFISTVEVVNNFGPSFFVPQRWSPQTSRR